MTALRQFEKAAAVAFILVGVVGCGEERAEPGPASPPDDVAVDDGPPNVDDEEPLRQSPIDLGSMQPVSSDLECFGIKYPNAVMKVDPRTGAVSPTSLTRPGDSVGNHGLVVLDNHLVGCQEDPVAPWAVFSLDLVTGETNLFEQNCESVAVWREGLLVMRHDSQNTLFYYENGLADLVAGKPPVHLAVPFYASRMTVQGDTAYFAWHSTHEVDVVDLTTMTSLSSVSLENYNTWVLGMHVTTGGELFLNASWPESRIARLDAATGAALSDAAVDLQIEGLACR